MNMDQTGRSIVPFLLGAGVGAVAALLLAPKTGEDLRRDIAEGVSEGSKQLSARGGELKQRAQNAVAQAQEQVRGAFDAGHDAYNQAKNA